jgi:uncharacterized RDD family membrane protein YckC
MVYSGFWKRFLAVLLDFAILILPMIALSWVMPYAGSVILAVFYYPIFESSPLQATPGKFWMGLKVVGENGQTLSFPRALGRFFLKYVSSVLLMLGYFIQLFTAKRQTLHDLVVNSVVIDHVFTISPDWIQTWLQQARYVLRVDEAAPTHVVQTEAKPASETVQDAEFTEVTEPTATAGNSASADTSSSADAVQAIEKLYELYKGGALTEDEFQSKKTELLKQV